jgi:hypothetical protein
MWYPNVHDRRETFFDRPVIDQLQFGDRSPGGM